jgi:DNA repair exonuclease SbcCD ATPase subunit
VEPDELIQTMRTCGSIGDIHRQLEIYKKKWPMLYHAIVEFYRDVKEKRKTPVRVLKDDSCPLCKQKLPQEEQSRRQSAGTGSPADLR